jgi:hypothetical protein
VEILIQLIWPTVGSDAQLLCLKNRDKDGKIFLKYILKCIQLEIKIKLIWRTTWSGGQILCLEDRDADTKILLKCIPEGLDWDDLAHCRFR